MIVKNEILVSRCRFCNILDNIPSTCRPFFTMGAPLATTKWVAATVVATDGASMGSGVATDGLPWVASTGTQVFDLCESVQICRKFSAGFCKDRCVETWRILQICGIFTEVSRFSYCKDYCSNMYFLQLSGFPLWIRFRVLGVTITLISKVFSARSKFNGHFLPVFGQFSVPLSNFLTSELCHSHAFKR